MSLPWIDHVARVGADVSLSSVSRTRMADGPSFACVDGQGGDSPTALATLDALLARAPRGRWRRMDSLTVLLGFPYARYTVLPWVDALYKPAQRQRHAHALLAGQAGDGVHAASGGSSIWIEETRFGAPALAAAVETAMLRAIVAMAVRHRMRVVACRALLADALLHHGQRLPDDTLLAVPEGHACSFALRRDGCWRTAFSLVFTHGALDRQVAAAWAMLGQSPGRLHVVATTHAHPASPSSGMLAQAVWLSDRPCEEAGDAA